MEFQAPIENIAKLFRRIIWIFGILESMGSCSTIRKPWWFSSRMSKRQVADENENSILTYSKTTWEGFSNKSICSKLILCGERDSNP